MPSQWTGKTQEDIIKNFDEHDDDDDDDDDHDDHDNHEDHEALHAIRKLCVFIYVKSLIVVDEFQLPLEKFPQA